MKHRRLLWAVVSIVLPVVLLLLLPPSLARLLLWPGVRFATVLRLNTSGDVAPIVLQVVVSWALCAVVCAALIVLVGQTLWRRKVLLVICASIFCAAVSVVGRGERNRIFQGTWEPGFERSAFYPRGECWRPPYWLVANPDMYKKLSESRQTGALNITFEGDASAIGRYGHLGGYLREIRIARVIEAKPATPCQSTSW